MRAPLMFGLTLAAGLLSALGPSTAAGQNRRWQIGLVGGLNSARWSALEPDEETAGSGISIQQDRRTDMLLGLAFTRPLSQTVDFAPELIYTRKGTALRIAATFPDGFFGSEGPQTFTSRGSVALSYLEVPALFRIRLPQVAKGMPYLLVGPTKMTSSTTLAGGDESSSEDCGEDSEGGVRKNDVGALAGVGMQFNSVGLSLRYERGLRSLNMTDDSDPITNRVVSLTATYTLGKRK
jgi:hypothetical protein